MPNRNEYLKWFDRYYMLEQETLKTTYNYQTSENIGAVLVKCRYVEKECDIHRDTISQ